MVTVLKASHCPNPLTVFSLFQDTLNCSKMWSLEGVAKATVSVCATLMGVTAAAMISRATHACRDDGFSLEGGKERRRGEINHGFALCAVCGLGRRLWTLLQWMEQMKERGRRSKGLLQRLPRQRRRSTETRSG